ncbi:MAG: right-handed parallel beta-helix repeat-containing protein [Anaerolineales bacterium]
MKVRILLRVLLALILSITVAGQFPQSASANTYTVINTNNSGLGSLRQAIDDANSNLGLDTIDFDITGCSGVCTIQLTNPLPIIDDPVYIDGLSQTGASAGDLWAGTGHTLLIEIDGSLLPSSPNGLYMTAGNSTVRGLVINNFPGNGIFIMTNGGNTIETNYIGTNSTGVGNLGNELSGIVLNNVGSNTIGGSAPGAGNLISGNDDYGIYIQGSSAASNQIQGNFIGTDVDGTQRIRNGQGGILISDAPWNVIGESTAGARNLISGNTGYGILISGTGAFINSVRGNYIGTTRHGTVLPYDVGNSLDGIRITNSDHNTIGGDASGEGNLISGNTGAGIAISGSNAQNNDIFGNSIGTDKNGTAVIPNGGDGVSISNGTKYTDVGGGAAGQANVISGNGLAGVYLTGSGTSFNNVVGNFIGTDGSGAGALGNSRHGVQIRAMAEQNTVGGDTPAERNVISGNTWSGVQVTGLGTDYNLIKGNFIGTDSTGTSALPNENDGVLFVEGARWNTIGGTNPGEGNLISGNAWSGVSIYGSNTDSNYVFGNFVGTDVTGTSDLGNSWIGVFIGYDAENNTVGGSTTNHRNVISGNDLEGIQLRGSGTRNNTVMGNYIGLTVDGEIALGNTLDGVLIFDSASNNIVGGDVLGEGNVVSGNGSCGVSIYGSGTVSNIVSGNFLGTDKDGTDAHPNGLHGVFIGLSATGNRVGGTSTGERNVISGNAQDGIRIENSGTGFNTVEGNYIGTTASGLSGLHNTGSGVLLRDGAQNNTVGGDVPAERNIISGNWGSGVALRGASTSGNTISGNYIGVNPTGTVGLGNSGEGVFIDSGAHNNTIGGMASGRGNVIGDNSQGMRIDGAGTDDNTVAGNYIGTDRTGMIDLGHFPQNGVIILNGASDNTIGPGNTIAYNAVDGVRVYGASTTGNKVTRNRIYQNSAEGITLGSGANNGILAPVITGTSMGPVTITGTVPSCSGCTIEVFSNPDTDGEGKTYLGSTTVAGTSWSLVVPGIGDPYLTATVTHATNGTSEFSGVFVSTVRSIFLPLIMR